VIAKAAAEGTVAETVNTSEAARTHGTGVRIMIKAEAREIDFFNGLP
jgi:hypothetical protein